MSAALHSGVGPEVVSAYGKTDERQEGAWVERARTVSTRARTFLAGFSRPDSLGFVREPGQ
jgi:hypothetical protein